jgi:hypothetical protein
LIIYRDRKARPVQTDHPETTVSQVHQAIQANRAVKANGVSVRNIALSTAVSSSKTALDDKSQYQHEDNNTIVLFHLLIVLFHSATKWSTTIQQSSSLPVFSSFNI